MAKACKVGIEIEVVEMASSASASHLFGPGRRSPIVERWHRAVPLSAVELEAVPGQEGEQAETGGDKCADGQLGR